MTLKEQLKQYIPYNEQEEKDRDLIVEHLENSKNIFTRENRTAHMTASAWVVSEDHSEVLMAYHNLYDSWAWLGGHADGEENLLNVAIREVKEESGIHDVRPYAEDIFSVEVLTVDGHVKKGEYVSSHLHLNVTYLLVADPHQSIHNKPDENKAVGWFKPEEVYVRSSEPWFIEHIYKKLNEKMAVLFEKEESQ
ncbi:MAG: NUDIX hydrolase [Erysipelotrichaceae bacterium]|nr:NUDIX hydrolase [Erysipelotrichaceae bacterium]